MPIPQNATYWQNNENVYDAKGALADLVRFEPERVIEAAHPFSKLQRRLLDIADHQHVTYETSRIQGTKKFELSALVSGTIPYKPHSSTMQFVDINVGQGEVARLCRRHREIVVNHVFALRRQRLIDALANIDGWSPDIEIIEKRLEKLEAGYAGMIQSFVLARGSD